MEPTSPGSRGKATEVGFVSQLKVLSEAHEKPPEDGGTRNSANVGEWIEAKTTKKVMSK
jgi:hypothetical protein